MTSTDSKVYFIKPIGMDGPIKIGCSKEPEKRLATLASWSPFPLEIICTTSGTSQDEGALHRRFSHLHTHREWFLSSPELRQAIEELSAGKTISEVCASMQDRGAIRNQKRPTSTTDRELFLQYGRKVRAALSGQHNKQGSWYTPSYIKKIMHDWRCDRGVGHLPIIPTAEQFRLLDEFIADPMPRAVFRQWRGNDPVPTHDNNINAPEAERAA